MKTKVILVIIFLSIAVCSNSQEAPCYNDSTLLDKSSLAVDDMLQKQQTYVFANKFLDNLLSESKSTCNLIIWANLFDDFLKKGLKITERLPKPVARNNSFILNQVETKKKDDPNKIYFTFKLFANLKSKYELQYDSFNERDFINTVNEIIKYGRYSHPTIVKNILLNNYPEINQDKFHKDMRYYDSGRN